MNLVPLRYEQPRMRSVRCATPHLVLGEGADRTLFWMDMLALHYRPIGE
ncbi:hypothetical protein N8996_02380 [Candidatus Poseidonia alphae]|nr:hypothetical protein [Candidatus Poseidonia alphae]